MLGQCFIDIIPVVMNVSELATASERQRVKERELQEVVFISLNFILIFLVC